MSHKRGSVHLRDPVPAPDNRKEGAEVEMLIKTFQIAREMSLAIDEQMRREGAVDVELQGIVIPFVQLDLIILTLEGARDETQRLGRLLRRTRRLAEVSALASAVAFLLMIAGWWLA
jgi:hypothetical protein